MVQNSFDTIQFAIQLSCQVYTCFYWLFTFSFGFCCLSVGTLRSRYTFIPFRLLFQISKYPTHIKLLVFDSLVSEWPATLTFTFT